MTYEIRWKPRPLKFLSNLDKQISKRIIKKVRLLEENPFRYLEHFEKEGHYKLRIGDFRLIFTIDFENKVLIVEVLDKRGRVYKR